MPNPDPTSRSNSVASARLSRAEKEANDLQKMLAGFILIQAALCGLTVCLVLADSTVTWYRAAISTGGLLIAFSSVAWLAQEIPVRALRRLQMRRKVDKRLLARTMGPRVAVKPLRVSDEPTISFGSARVQQALRIQLDAATGAAGSNPISSVIGK